MYKGQTKDIDMAKDIDKSQIDKDKGRDTLHVASFRALPQMTVLLDPTLKILDATDLYLSATYRDRNAIVGSQLLAEFPENQNSKNMAQRVKDSIEACVKTLKHQDIETFRYDIRDNTNSKSGEWIPRFWRGSSHPIMDQKSGSLVAVAHTVMDVTEDVRTDKAIDVGKRADLFRMVIENLRDYSFFMLDPNGYICSWNLGAEKMKQYKAEEAIGKHFSIFFTQEDLEKGKPQKELDQALAHGRTEDEYWRVRKDGTLFWGNVILSSVFDEQKTLIGFVKITRDLTERKANEQHLLTAYEESAKLKAEFLANMSHEIRTPLNGITSAVNLMKDSNLDASQSELLEIVLTSSRIMIKLVNDILDYSEMESDRVYYHVEPFDLYAEVTTTLDNHKAHNASKNLGVHLTIDQDVPNRVKGDRLRLHQVLNNLIDNAFKFTEEGQVTVQVKLLSRNGIDVSIRIEIIDTGIGIAKSDVDKLFTPFSQLESFNTKRYRGTGLGLAICKKVLDILQGTIEISSVLGAGTTVKVTLPFKEYRQVLPSTTNSKYITPLTSNFVAPNYPESSILVAEDNAINQTMILRVLRKLGYSNITLAENGLQAVQKSRERQYDIILMDIQMPKMDGIEATQIIRKENKTVPIVAMTANALQGDAERYLYVGMNDYISKPIDFKLLSSILNRWIEI